MLPAVNVRRYRKCCILRFAGICVFVFTEPLNLSRKSLGNCGILKGNYNYIMSTHGREWEFAILDTGMVWIISRRIGGVAH